MTLTIGLPNIRPALAPVTHEGNPMIDARALHGWLGNKKHFNDWVKARIEDYGFTEGADFSLIRVKTGGRPRIDYLLTVDMAKELSMVERTGAIRFTEYPMLSPVATGKVSREKRPAHHRDRRGTVVRSQGRVPHPRAGDGRWDVSAHEGTG